jgi:hypothetical protein
MAGSTVLVTLRPTMATWTRHRYEPSDTAVGAACLICGQRPSPMSAGDPWHETDQALAVTRWQSSASAVIWWHTPLGDQPVVLRLGWLH